jgi:hypothetical protein
LYGIFKEVLSIEFAEEEINEIDEFSDEDLVLGFVCLTKSFKCSINETDVRGYLLVGLIRNSKV